MTIEEEFKQTYPEHGQQMLNDYRKEGGLFCLQKWGDAFSFTSGTKNAVDILLNHNELLRN